MRAAAPAAPAGMRCPPCTTKDVVLVLGVTAPDRNVTVLLPKDGPLCSLLPLLLPLSLVRLWFTLPGEFVAAAVLAGGLFPSNGFGLRSRAVLRTELAECSRKAVRILEALEEEDVKADPPLRLPETNLPFWLGGLSGWFSSRGPKRGEILSNGLCRLSADTDRGVDDMYGAAGGLPRGDRGALGESSTSSLFCNDNLGIMYRSDGDRERFVFLPTDDVTPADAAMSDQT